MAKDDRLFAPFPIEMDEHPKIIVLSDAAFRAVFEATFYSRRMMSDGFLDDRVVMKRWGQSVADELSSNDPERPSWIRVEHGWRIHDFEKHHPLRAEIQEKRDAVSKLNSEKGKRSAAAKRAKAEQEANRIEPDFNRASTEFNSETETETETTTTPNGVVPRKRGTRIPEPFIVNGEMRAWAAERVPGVDVNASTEKFVNHWRAKTRDATKLDWLATWHNWLINDFERKAPTGKPTKTERAMNVIEMGKQRDRAKQQGVIEA